MANWYKKSQAINPTPNQSDEIGMPPRMARYRTTIIIEARVPENADRNAEIQAAKAKAEDMFQSLQGVIGDDAIGLDSSATRLGSSLEGESVTW